MAPQREQWLELSESERRTLAQEACRSGNAEALWSLAVAYLAAHRTRERPLSPHTLRTYRQSVDMLVDRWPGEALLSPTPSMVTDLIRALAESGASLSTIKVRLAGAHALYRALLWVGATKQDPFHTIGPVTGAGQPRRRQPYSPEEQEDLLRHADPVDRALILLSCRAGFSLSECTALRWSDLDLTNGRLLRKSRDGSERSVLLPSSVVETLQSLPSGDGDGILGFTSDVRARQRMKRLCERAGVPYRGVQALRLGGCTEHRDGAAGPRPIGTGRGIAAAPTESIADYGRLQEELARVNAESERFGSSFGILTISVDGLPSTEDAKATELAQAVLHACAARIARIRRRYDLVARCSPETFCVVLKNLEPTVDLSRIARRFSHALHANPVTVEGSTFEVRVRLDSGMGPDATAWLLGNDRGGPEEPRAHGVGRARPPALGPLGRALGAK